mgnify:CR=1 FL=1
MLDCVAVCCVNNERGVEISYVDTDSCVGSLLLCI